MDVTTGPIKRWEVEVAFDQNMGVLKPEGASDVSCRCNVCTYKNAKHNGEQALGTKLELGWNSQTTAANVLWFKFNGGICGGPEQVEPPICTEDDVDYPDCLTKSMIIATYDIIDIEICFQ